jgi:hypothetical protein
LIKIEDIIKLADEFNLSRNHYTNSVTLSMPIINHNVPDVFDFRCNNGTYDLNSYLTNIDKDKGLVYTLIFGTNGDCYEFCRLKFMEFDLVYKKYKQELRIEELNGDFKDDDEGTI